MRHRRAELPEGALDVSPILMPPWQFYATDNMPTRIARSLDEVEQYVSEFFSGQEKYARQSARVFIGEGMKRDDLWSYPIVFGVKLVLCEALVPVHRGGIGYVGYYGWCDPRIVLPTHVWAQERKLLRQATVGATSGALTLLPPGFSSEVFVAGAVWQGDDLENVLSIYMTAFSDYVAFAQGNESFSNEVVRALVLGSSGVRVRDDQGKIAAIALFDRADFTDLDLVMAEITEVAVSPAARGLGLAKVLYTTALEFLGDTGVDVAYSECRGSSIGILRTAAQAGMHPCGTLRSHIVIDSPNNNNIRYLNPRGTPFEDLVIFSKNFARAKF